MKKFGELSFESQVFWSYFVSLIISLASSPFFFKIYSWSFNPPRYGGGFFYVPNFINIAFTGGLFAFYFFLSFFVFFLLSKKQIFIWAIGFIVPLLLSFTGGKKYIFWALLLSLSGWLLAQIILFIKRRIV